MVNNLPMETLTLHLSTSLMAAFGSCGVPMPLSKTPLSHVLWSYLTKTCKNENPRVYKLNCLQQTHHWNSRLQQFKCFELFFFFFYKAPKSRG